ncbi:unnamed protein product [Larinioides sclopetarius]|uniref:Uncharacterized protein n=1 Tax=Larinioides sclopetarius TaxID=280406 RepID=A0AAV1Z5P1_9ARAC
MYTISNRPYKLIANTRRGIAQKVDPLESSSNNRELVKCGNNTDMNLPKPVFNHQVNGKKTQIQKAKQENFPPQYEEFVKYIQDTWTGVVKEYDTSKQSPDNKVPKVVFYQDTSSSSQLANFKPFDLESFWGERFLRKIKLTS